MDRAARVRLATPASTRVASANGVTNAINAQQEHSKANQNKQAVLNAPGEHTRPLSVQLHAYLARAAALERSAKAVALQPRGRAQIVPRVSRNRDKAQPGAPSARLVMPGASLWLVKRIAQSVPTASTSPMQELLHASHAKSVMVAPTGRRAELRARVIVPSAPLGSLRPTAV